ncbi:hypothetical protein B0H14DRAFT_2611053 [Mycena olivaceomarginata]|nr:hypothetical protein B0H14DRAFT_2611053 [Mycena olivaceomarginata]
MHPSLPLLAKLRLTYSSTTLAHRERRGMSQYPSHLVLPSSAEERGEKRSARSGVWSRQSFHRAVVKEVDSGGRMRDVVRQCHTMEAPMAVVASAAVAERKEGGVYWWSVSRSMGTGEDGARVWRVVLIREVEYKRIDSQRERDLAPSARNRPRGARTCTKPATYPQPGSPPCGGAAVGDHHPFAHHTPPSLRAPPPRRPGLHEREHQPPPLRWRRGGARCEFATVNLRPKRSEEKEGGWMGARQAGAPEGGGSQRADGGACTIRGSVGRATPSPRAGDARQGPRTTGGIPVPNLEPLRARKRDDTVANACSRYLAPPFEHSKLQVISDPNSTLVSRSCRRTTDTGRESGPRSGCGTSGGAGEQGSKSKGGRGGRGNEMRSRGEQDVGKGTGQQTVARRRWSVRSRAVGVPVCWWTRRTVDAHGVEDHKKNAEVRWKGIPARGQHAVGFLVRPGALSLTSHPRKRRRQYLRAAESGSRECKPEGMGGWLDETYPDSARRLQEGKVIGPSANHTAGTGAMPRMHMPLSGLKHPTKEDEIHREAGSGSTIAIARRKGQADLELVVVQVVLDYMHVVTNVSYLSVDRLVASGLVVTLPQDMPPALRSDNISEMERQEWVGVLGFTAQNLCLKV